MTCFRRLGRCSVCHQWMAVTSRRFTLVGHSAPGTKTTCPGSYLAGSETKAVER